MHTSAVNSRSNYDFLHVFVVCEQCSECESGAMHVDATNAMGVIMTLGLDGRVL